MPVDTLISRLFHTWERRLVAETTDRVVRPFDWGLDWIGSNCDSSASPAEALRRWTREVMADTDQFFAAPPTTEYRLDEDCLRFPSAYETPHKANNTVYARYLPSAGGHGPTRRAVVVLPHWNADADSHMALCRLLARNRVSALRLSLPYHDRRMPAELHRADYIVSANVGRTIQVCRQAVVDARRAIDWLQARGYERVGVLGTSLGSCLSMLTAAHDPRVSVAALNHISPFFADVVWEGLATAHVRAGLNGSIDLPLLRELWRPISPAPYVDRLASTRVLLVYARYDLSFPIRLSRALVDDFRARGMAPEVFVLPCGHYSTGIAPFSWLDGFALVRFLRRHL